MRRAEWLIERPWRLAALVFLLALPLVVVGELNTLDAQQRLERDRRDAIRSGASRAAEAIASRSDALFTAISGVGETERFRDSLGVAIRRDATAPVEQIVPADDRELTLQLVALHAATRNDLALLFAVDGAGIVHAAHPPVVAGQSTHETLVGSDQRNAPYSLALANRDPRYIGSYGGNMFIAVPVGETVRGPGGTRGGAVVGQLAADAITRWLAALSGSVADIHVVDRTGTPLARLNGAIASPDISGHVAVRSALSGQPFVGQAPALTDPGSALLATAQVGNLGWHVIAQARPDLAQAELDSALMQQRGLRLGLFAALLLGTALVGVSSSRAVRQRRETKVALAQQTALSEVLKTISRSAFDLEAVLQTIVERAAELCHADGAAIYRRVGDVAIASATFGDVGTLPGQAIPIDDRTVVGRAMRTASRQYISDARQHPDLPQDGPHTRLNIPFVRDGVAIGALAVLRRVARPFNDSELRLFEVFADQAAIAIENVRLFNETKEALAQQTALSEVLNTISRSAFDLDSVLQTIVERATALCDADGAAIHRRDGDVYFVAAQHGEVMTRLRPVGTPVEIDDETVAGRAMLTGERQYIPNVREEPTLPQGGPQTRLCIPFVRDGRTIGALGVVRAIARPYSDAELRLFEVFADQAAIAIENVRLFNETKESLERQTALGDVLRTMASSPADRQPVLDAIARSAARFCAAEDCGVALLRPDGLLEQVAHFGPIARALEPWPVDRGSVRGRAIVDREIVHVKDMLAESEHEYPIGVRRAREVGQRTVLAAPLLREGVPLGAIALRRTDVKPFSERQIELLRTFADQAVVAIENVRLFNETKASLERQTALAEILRVIADSPADQQPVVDAVARNTTRYCGAVDAAVFLVEGNAIRRVAHHGPLPSVAEPLVPIERGAVAGRAVLERRTVHLADAAGAEADDFPITRGLAARSGHHGTLATPMMREGRAVGVILLRKIEMGGFSPSQIQLVEAFADQAVIAIENVRLFNETSEALERQTATSSILNVISRSPADQQPTLDAIVESGARLCDADMAFIYVVEQGFFKLRAGYKVPPAFVDYTNADPIRVVPHRGSLSGRVVAERRAVQIPDVLVDAEYSYLEGQRLVGYRSMLNVPMFSKGELIGLIGLWRTAPVAFTAKQIDLMSTFADQAVIAIENTRLFNETKEALERQTSISDVLQTIGRSAFDLQPVLDTVVERAVRLCDAHDGSISTLEDGVYRTRSYWSVGLLPAAYIELMLQEVHTPERGSLVGRTALEGRVVQIADVLEDPEYTLVDMQQSAGYRTVLGVPLLRDGRVIGVFALARNEVRPFTDRQIELVRTFADQAAIAIENTRLFAATKEALEQQTAVGEVLKTISRSAFDLKPVLDIVLNNAVRLAGADIGWLSRVENEQFMTVAYSTEFPESVHEELVRERAQGHIGGPWRPLGTGGGLMGFTLAEGRTVHLPDVKADPDLKGSVVARLTESRTVVGVPMLRDGRSIGGMVLARYAVRPFSEREIELVQTFADQAAIAIENVRLFNETKEALERQSAVSEVLKTITRTVFDIGPTLQTIVENAARLADADMAWMNRRTGEDTLESAGGYYARTPELVLLFDEERRLDNLRPEGSTRSRRVGHISSMTFQEARPFRYDDVMAIPAFQDQPSTARRMGARSVLSVPVLNEGRAIAVMVLARRTVRPFDERALQLVETFADQAAIAINNVNLFNEIKDKGRQLEVASRHKSEFLANMSHELRTPLNAIIGFSEVLVQGLFGEVNSKQREYLQDVIGSGQHLLSLINDILDLAKIEAGRMELELSTFSFRSALQSGVTIVRERAARNGITLNVDVSNELDRVEADERKVKQILYNLLSNAVKFTPDGGNVNVTVRRDNGDVRVDIQDNGIGIAEADQARIFEEFQQVGRERSREGTGLGLTLTKRFVELHGGRIWLESAPGRGSTFTFTLPLRQVAPVRA